jgi:hypothetical protein
MKNPHATAEMFDALKQNQVRGGPVVGPAARRALPPTAPVACLAAAAARRRARAATPPLDAVFGTL